MSGHEEKEAGVTVGEVREAKCERSNIPLTYVMENVYRHMQSGNEFLYWICLCRDSAWALLLLRTGSDDHRFTPSPVSGVITSAPVLGVNLPITLFLELAPGKSGGVSLDARN